MNFVGGSGMAVPALSLEVDSLQVALRRAKDAGFAIEYGPVEEPWGVRRFFTRDPFGKLVNILVHLYACCPVWEKFGLTNFLKLFKRVFVAWEGA